MVRSDTMEGRVTSGSGVIDGLLSGGYENDIITTIYGPAGTGKTTMCLMCSLAVCATGKKVIYIDTEGGFSVERLRQLEGYSDEVLKSILILKPTSFEEQHKIFSTVRQMVNAKIGLVVVDTISMLYRIACGGTKDVKMVNNQMGLQISVLSEIARTSHIPVLLTNQVYSDFGERDSVKMVGGELLSYSSKCLIELMKYKNMRKALVRKHRSLPENKEIVFQIVEKGFQSTHE
jgi:DNA repair protein RadB